MKFDEPNYWAARLWPDFLEMLRAFCLSDAEQAAYFPTLQEPRYHASSGGDDYSRCAYSMFYSDVYDLCVSYSGHCEEKDEEIFFRLSALFGKARDKVLAPLESPPIFPYVAQTDARALKRMRPRLRAASENALDYFGAEKRAPSVSWQELL